MAGVRQMRPFDPYMKRVAEHRWDVPTLTIWNPIDGIILPGRHTRWDVAGGEHVCCTVPVHAWPVWSKAVQQRVVDFLAAGGGLTSPCSGGRRYRCHPEGSGSDPRDLGVGRRQLR
jgi:hypothetical protein